MDEDVLALPFIECFLYKQWSPFLVGRTYMV